MDLLSCHSHPWPFSHSCFPRCQGYLGYDELEFLLKEAAVKSNMKPLNDVTVRYAIGALLDDAETGTEATEDATSFEKSSLFLQETDLVVEGGLTEQQFVNLFQQASTTDPLELSIWCLCDCF